MFKNHVGVGVGVGHVNKESLIPNNAAKAIHQWWDLESQAVDDPEAYDTTDDRRWRRRKYHSIGV